MPFPPKIVDKRVHSNGEEDVTQGYSGLSDTHGNTKILRTYKDVEKPYPRFVDGRTLQKGEMGIFISELSNQETPSQEVTCYLTAAYVYQRGVAEEHGHSPLFPFCRLAKRHPDLLPLSSTSALAAAERWLDSLARPRRSEAWRFWFPEFRSIEDAKMEFISTWDQIRWLPGYTPLASAVEQARAHPLRLKKECTPGYGLFVSVAYQLQIMVRTHTILLPCHSLAPLLEVAPMTVSRYRTKAIQERLLTIARRHNYNAGEATEFRFNFRRLTEATDYEVCD